MRLLYTCYNDGEHVQKYCLRKKHNGYQNEVKAVSKKARRDGQASSNGEMREEAYRTGRDMFARDRVDCLEDGEQSMSLDADC
jgi:hypothetical protein